MQNPFRYRNTSPDVIRLTVRMYIRYPLSLRQVEDLPYERVRCQSFAERVALFVTEALVRFCFSLGSGALVLQPAFLDCPFLDLLSQFRDFCAASVIDVSRRQVAQALVVSAVVVVVDEGADGGLQLAG